MRTQNVQHTADGRAKPDKRGVFPGILCALSLIATAPGPAPASVLSSESTAQAAAGERNGQRDFDWEIGTWTTRVSRLVRPLSGSTTWTEYQGTSVVRKIWDGRANLVELKVEGPQGRIEGLSLRLYHPQSGEWSLHYASSTDGALTPPVTGKFTDGRGEFSGPDTLGNQRIMVRFVITQIAADSWRFEQAFSKDDGKTWEVNWKAVDTRVR